MNSNKMDLYFNYKILVESLFHIIPLQPSEVQLVELLLQHREVQGLVPGHDIPKLLKIVLPAWHSRFMR